jgi:hypothetical protein
MLKNLKDFADIDFSKLSKAEIIKIVRKTFDVALELSEDVEDKAQTVRDLRKALRASQAKSCVTIEQIWKGLPDEYKVCYRCGAPVTIRHQKKTHIAFIGCTDYPACLKTRSINSDVTSAALRTFNAWDD